ncbi:MAG: hypothetical protein L6R43_12985 [Planctomycetes bacterium]|nr:hypothetical protein [Planctomycetota bacterium]
MWRFREQKCGAHEDTYAAAVLWVCILAAFWLWRWWSALLGIAVLATALGLLWLVASRAGLLPKKRRRRKP